MVTEVARFETFNSATSLAGQQCDPAPITVSPLDIHLPPTMPSRSFESKRGNPLTKVAVITASLYKRDLQYSMLESKEKRRQKEIHEKCI